MSGSTSRFARPKDAFEFGRNWQRYLDRYLDSERKEIAAESLRALVGEPLEGKVFVDIGAGSGLFSLCAHDLGASRVVSIDVDPEAVVAAERLRAAAGSPEQWEVFEASILDPQLPERLPRADIVYSWGVLHHTGDMFAAIRNAAGVVAPGGVFCIAIYNRVTGRLLDSRRWRSVKRFYNRSPSAIRRVLEALYFTYWLAHQIRARRNPVSAAAEYKASRGMGLLTDLVDWLGGYPYEFASVDEIVYFCRDECGLDLVRVIPTTPGGLGNNEFVFRRP
ncbi:MAG TPA: class I SAM-dependent methyltransferase [Gaiellaceae bacterium]|jgi:2-polyprenyl-3-methyl-5-hydroxy-6-metoxy-1,4-benzoquinol methylase|nr:class I SAM-dependent methyltransferase [Gaiellaceae bacterium]